VRLNLKADTFRVRLKDTRVPLTQGPGAQHEIAMMTSPRATPEQDLPADAQAPPDSPARELSNEELRVKVAALAEQVRQLGNGSHPMPEWRPAQAVPGDRDPVPSDRGGGPDPGVASAAGDPAPHLPQSSGDRSTEPGEPSSAGGSADLAQQNSRLLAAVIETAELAAAEIRASAEREAAGIRERAATAVGEANAALARYREALGALHGETEWVERSIVALREQTRALEIDRANIDAAVELLRRHSPPRQ
jgi:hypothetical protein